MNHLLRYELAFLDEYYPKGDVDMSKLPTDLGVDTFLWRMKRDIGPSSRLQAAFPSRYATKCVAGSGPLPRSCAATTCAEQGSYSRCSDVSACVDTDCNVPDLNETVMDSFIALRSQLQELRTNLTVGLLGQVVGAMHDGAKQVQVSAAFSSAPCTAFPWPLTALVIVFLPLRCRLSPLLLLYARSAGASAVSPRSVSSS